MCRALKYFIIIIPGFLLSGKLSAQPEIIIPGNFNHISFDHFVNDIENSTPLRFYYEIDNTAEIYITAAGDSIRLAQLLDDHIKASGLEYYIDGNRVYIFQGAPILTELPSFQKSNSRPDKPDTLPGITETERKYLKGKMISPVEVIEVGSKNGIAGKTKCIINGKVIDAVNSEPLTGATIFIKELSNGAVADIDGNFKLMLDPGKYNVVCTYVSMKQKEYILQVYSGGSFVVEMKKELIELGEVRVSANRYNHVKGMQMGFERVTSKTIKEIPVIFGEKDLLKVAQMLPGVVNAGEGSSGFNVRGGAADQNMFYINKIPVYNTSHLFGFFTSFSPDIVNDFTLYKSNIPASYGGRLSSIFTITTRQGSKKKFFGQGGISPITAHFSLEAPVIRDKLSVVTSFRSSYSDWILKKIKDGDIRNSNAFFYDATISANLAVNDRNLIKAFGYASEDRFSLSSINDYNYSNKGSSLSWKHIFNASISADIAAIYSKYSFENTNKTNNSTAFTQEYEINHYEVRTDFSLLTNIGHKLELGGSGIYYDLDRGSIKPYGDESNRSPFYPGRETALEYAIYISDEFSLMSDLTVQAGLRYSFFNQFGPGSVNLYQPVNQLTVENISETKEYKPGEMIKAYSGPEYRFAINYSPGSNHSLKASYNRMLQYIFMLSNTIAISPDDRWKLCDYHIAPPVSDQVAIGYYKDFPNIGIKASLELYHKWIDKQVEYKDGIDFISADPVETMILQGKQRVNGLEMMINKNAGKISGWLSYCYSRSFVKVDDAIRENQINYGMEYPSNYDRPHSINVVMNYRINRRLSLSSNFVYTSGRPVTYPVSVYYSEGQEMLLFSKRNEFRIPDYARLDLSINLEGSLFRKKPIHSFWMLNIYNVLARKNAYSVYYEANDGKVSGKMLSIFGVPLVSLSWNYKFGNYLND